MFSRAIVRTPGRSMTRGLTTSDLGEPDHELALIQHRAYVQALTDCGLDVFVMDADEQYPDSTFIEDAALLTSECAIITNPGAPTRQGEVKAVRAALESYYDRIETVEPPGTVEGGDIMMVGSHFYIGLSERTNQDGARQVISTLEKHGLSGSMIQVKDSLHLKTGIAYLEDNTVIGYKPYIEAAEFQAFKILEVNPEESYAANCIWVNGTVLVARGFPGVSRTISNAGYPIIELDVSEFQKLDGGLSCLSLRF